MYTRLSESLRAASRRRGASERKLVESSWRLALCLSSLLGCSSEESAPTEPAAEASSFECEGTDEVLGGWGDASVSGGRGSWEVVPQPDELTGQFISSGAGLSGASEDKVWLANTVYLAAFHPSSGEMEVIKTEREDSSVALSGHVLLASEQHVAIDGGANANRLNQSFLFEAELIDIAAAQRVRVRQPEDQLLWVPGQGNCHKWSGDFLFSEQRAFSPDETTQLFLVKLDPNTGEWSQLPVGDTGVVAGEGNGYPSEHFATALVGDQLFTWGVSYDRKRRFSLVFDLESETWGSLDVADDPPRRISFDLVAADEGVYMVGGRTVDSEERIRELWHYSLREDTWTEVQVPKWVHARRGLWLEGKLYVLGSCQADAIYDPATKQWEPMAALNLPDNGRAFAVDGHIVLTETSSHHLDPDLPYLFVYTPED